MPAFLLLVAISAGELSQGCTGAAHLAGMHPSCFVLASLPRTCCSIDRRWSISSTISCMGRGSSRWAMLLTMERLLLLILDGRCGSGWLTEACL